MPSVNWTPSSRAELDKITDYLSQSGKSSEAVEVISRELLSDCDRYARFPHLGAAAPELGKNLRVFLHKRWAVIYRPVEDGIVVVGIVDAARDFPAWRRPP